MRRLPIAAVTLAFLLHALCLAAPVPVPQPSSTQPAITDLISQLGDRDPQVRERASKSLWALGRAAEPALRAAAAGDDPEAARRARAILREFTYGLYPDAPREIFALLDQYRKGDPQEKRIVIRELSTRGVPGLRVLLKLRDDERDPVLRQQIVLMLATREHDVAVLMLADGQTAEVGRMLESSAYDSPVAAHDYAALLLTGGTLQQELAKLKAQPVTERSAPVLAALARAAGDAATARMAAEKSGNTDLLDAVLIDQGDWKTLARQLAVSPRGLEPSERLGYLAAYYRLAGEPAEFETTARELITRARQTPGDYWACARNLFLNDRPDEGVSVLLDHHDYLQATNFLTPLLRFREAMELPKLAEEHQPGEAIKVKARTIGALQFVGRIDQAKRVMAEVAAENRLRNDFSTWVYLVEGAGQLGMTREADEYAAIVLQKATRQDPIAWLFEKMHFGNGSSALLWWQFLRQQHGTESVADTLHRLRSIFDQSISGQELDRLAGAAWQYAADLPAVERKTWQETVADTLNAAGRTDLAAQWVRRLADSSSTPAVLIHAGDFEADRKNWPTAAEDYAKAWEHDHTQAAALFLRGWALAQGGQEKIGQPMMELAHRLPLGDESGRYALLEALLRHKLSADARREIRLILIATAPRSWERNEALQRRAEELAGKGNFLAAAGMWQRAFLGNFSSNVAFVEPGANLVVPALIHKTRALGLIGAGQVDAAMVEANIALDGLPSDTDALIELIGALDKAGHRPQADALYQQHTMIYRKLIADYPDSSPAHNQLAWAQVMCHRELDEALKNAKRAVELEPASTASLDTLAEVYFARGDIPDAIAQMKRCIELEPKVERHRKQLARFEAALHSR